MRCGRSTSGRCTPRSSASSATGWSSPTTRAEDGPQKGFRITPEGEAELANWLRTPPDLSSPPRDELVIKVLGRHAVPGVDVHEVIQVHRRYLVQLMQEWTRLKEYAADRDLGFALAVDAELFRLDSVVRWLDAADGRIKRARVADRPASVAGRQPGCPKLPRKSWGCGDEPHWSCGRCPRSTARGRPRSTPCETSTCRSTPASWWPSWDRADRARAPC